MGEADGVTPEWSVSDEKIAVIEDGKLIGKADGVVTVTAVHGELKSQWPVAVGTAELLLPRMRKKMRMTMTALAC